ncbi:amidase [Paraburkholderia solisilvae]|uniref:Glutamyl-tRNA(Gln) amidotransferase subunit A n=1 Tax=Paraburkholderia solisilvae TaxID=624376 RepID=A0A6J5D094_9BURK|nr:amidase [Paraburkholderia solisilvae]CAB3746495.1 Glutamyl-tRNA(Gln) amidotransferase subunit A [Paraburkholderia solisilvae]
MTQDMLLEPGLNGAFVRDGFGALPVALAAKLAPPLAAVPAPAPHHAAQAASQHAARAPLAGQRLAVKDVFDVEGLRTGGGNPTWAAQQPLAKSTALVVERLLEQGAQWVGKTVTDELTYSLAGVNVHYGMPRNPANPRRIPGGSSSGSAVAVAAGHADIGLGTDCGGSVRLPASYCGIWGIRPTHGRIAANGCFTLAHSFDTIGWLTRDGALLTDVFNVLAHSTTQALPARVMLCLPDDLVTLLHVRVRAAFATAFDTLSGRFETSLLTSASLAPEAWSQCFRVLQAAEIAQQHGAWAMRHLDSFGDDVRARLKAAVTISDAQVHAANRMRSDAIRTLARIFDEPDTYIVMPTLPWIAPLIGTSGAEIDEVRVRSQQMLSLAGLAGLPQVSLPWASFDGAPLGLSVIGTRGDDEGVLAVARAVHDMLASAQTDG